MSLGNEGGKRKKQEILWNKPALAAKRPGKEPDETEKTISMDFCTLKMSLIVLPAEISHLLILMVHLVLIQVLILSIGSHPIFLYFSSVSPQVARLLLYKVLYMHKKTKNLS